jgi:hypothetical protein
MLNRLLNRLQKHIPYESDYRMLNVLYFDQ